MRKFKLNCYKEFKEYFDFLDVLIKTESSNKELFLENLNISPSSYRRAKKEGNKIGQVILKKLAIHFKYNLCSDSLIDDIERKINKIYFDIYYKHYENYSKHYEWLEYMINKRLIVFPLFKLFKLLLKINDNNNPNYIQEEYKSLYDEINNYKVFFKNNLIEVLEILDVTFVDDIDDYLLSKEFVNELSYHTLASRCAVLGRYFESIFFCDLVKKKYFEDENYKRIYYINLILISNYNYLFKFDKAKLLAEKQILTLESISNNLLEYNLTKSIYVISCLGLKDYKNVIRMLKDKDNYTLTEAFCILIAYFYTDKELYKKLFDELISDEDDSNKYLNILNDILFDNKKKIIDLKECNINKCVFLILKKM